MKESTYNKCIHFGIAISADNYILKPNLKLDIYTINEQYSNDYFTFIILNYLYILYYFNLIPICVPIVQELAIQPVQQSAPSRVGTSLFRRKI